MIHIMKLKKQYFNYIKYGTKRYEIRLNDKKRNLITKGDYIELQKEPSLEEKIIVRVNDILHYSTFHELLNNIDVKHLASSSTTKEKLNEDLDYFYPVESQKKYGVVAIKLNKTIFNKTNINNIPSDSKIFNELKNNYINFNEWFDKMKSINTEIYYTEKNHQLSSIMILKLNETDSQQFLKKGKILKIRTLLVEDKKKGIGKEYLNIADELAITNDIKYVYLTIKINNKQLLRFIENNGYTKYKKYNDEFVYYKEII